MPKLGNDAQLQIDIIAKQSGWALDGASLPIAAIVKREPINPLFANAAANKLKRPTIGFNFNQPAFA